MSIVNSVGERMFLDPRPNTTRPVRSPSIRRRNRKWLERRRQEDLTVRELAMLVGARAATVAAGILWAEAEEDRREAKIVASFQSPELCSITGLTVDDVCYLLDRYPPGTGLGDHPLFREILDPLWAKVVAMYPGVDDLLSAEAA